MPGAKSVIFGKSEIVKSSSIQRPVPDILNVEYHGRTVVLAYGKILLQGFEFHFFGTPLSLKEKVLHNADSLSLPCLLPLGILCILL
jgi:hypothetical protein